MRSGIDTMAQSELADALHVYFNLGELPDAVGQAVSHVVRICLQSSPALVFLKCVA